MAAGSSGRTGVCVTSGMIGSGRRGPGGSWERGQAYEPFDPGPSTHAAAGPPRQTGGKAGTRTRQYRVARRRIHASCRPQAGPSMPFRHRIRGQMPPPGSECPLPGLRHAGRCPMTMTPRIGCLAWKVTDGTSDRQGCPAAPLTTHRQPSAAHPCCAAPEQAAAQNVPMDFFLS